MHAHARLRLPGGGTTTVGHGDLIGRLWSNTVFLDDARVSEAHAMISMRGDELRLLALRGRFTVDDRAATEVALTRGQRIGLASDLDLVVEDVQIPDRVLGLGLDGQAPQVLLGVVSLRGGGAPALLPGHHADAAAWVWSTGEGWRVRSAGGDARDLEPGDEVVAGGAVWRAVAVPLRQAAGVETLVDRTLAGPLRVVARWTTARVEQGDRVAAVFDGVAARLITELALLDGTAPWRVVAGEVWRDDPDDGSLRRRWDTALTRLRRRLRDGRVRQDLVRADGLGNFSLHLEPGDRLDVEA